MQEGSYHGCLGHGEPRSEDLTCGPRLEALTLLCPANQISFHPTHWGKDANEIGTGNKVPSGARGQCAVTLSLSHGAMKPAA